MLELHSLIALAPSATSKVLLPHAHFFDHVVVNNHRYMASSRATQARLADALIAVRISNNGAVWVGELQDIFLVNQPAVGVHYFGRVRWLKPVEFDISNTLWHQFASLHVNLWEADKYLQDADEQPEEIIDLDQIYSHVVRQCVSVSDRTLWATIILNRDAKGEIVTLTQYWQYVCLASQLR
ncbi:hypothetical protein FIBSPDRAFT_888248 [Athelia psychrophila]|uniref:Uncharacterized protein n=1 Tax=Athelia psychrophila TaxID=1759441 RepID=A0A166NJS1_9AGAM|nr:hypothetical protein FIBSPDRAFT_888248 [Fibularhizoctonia sp. CBS 109695]